MAHVRKRTDLSEITRSLTSLIKMATDLQEQVLELQDEEAEVADEPSPAKVHVTDVLVADMATQKQDGRWMVGHMSDEEYLRKFMGGR